MKNNIREQRAITLVALIITIIVLLILAIVSINLVMNGGIIGRAENGTRIYSESEEKEQIQLGYKEYQMAQFTDNNPQLKVEGATVTAKNGGGWTVVFSSGRTYEVAADGTITDGETASSGAGQNVTPISKTASENFVGYYADIDDEPGVDGVIFADMLVGNTNGTQWSDGNGTYTITTKSADSLKDYYISQESYTWAGKTKPVLKAVNGAGDKRFYVMALADIDSNTHYWYINASENMSDYSTATSGDFGTGKKNTDDMIARWDKGAVSNGGYGDQDSNDMWGLIKTQVSEGWFVPSRGEWSAFAQELGITSSNRSDFGLSDYYWSSSQRNTYFAWYAYFNIGCMDYDTVSHSNYVRLATTF